METSINRSALWITLLVILFSIVSVSLSSDVDAHDDTELDENGLSPRPLVKRNVAWWARSGRRKFFFNPQQAAGKRNVAWLARTGGRDTVLFPADNKRAEGLEGDDDDSPYEPYTDEEMDYLDESSPYYLDKRNIASLVNSRTIPSFITGYKRHVGPALRYRGTSPRTTYDMYDRPDKRYFASLLKSETPPASIYPRMNRRYSYFDSSTPSKRFFSTLLENDYGVPGEDAEKRSLGSLLKSDSYKGKRSFASLLKSDSGIGMSGKRYYSSLLDDAKSEDKRFVASLLKSKSFQDVGQGPSNELLGSIYDRQGNGIDKRHFASLINRQNPYSNGKHITKRHVGSLRDTSKRFYGSLLDNTKDEEPYDKRSFGSLLKSSNYRKPDKKHLGSAMRYRPDKREPLEDEALTDEEMQLDALEKRFLGSLLDSTSQEKLYGHSPGKRHFSSLIDNREGRNDVLYDEDAYPLEENEDKRHMASLLDSRSPIGKRFLASILDSKMPYENNPEEKRFLGSAINSRMSYKNEGKRFLGSAINSRMNYKNEDKRFLGSALNTQSDQDAEKRFVGSIVQSRDNNKNEGKRFFASVLDNSRNSNDASSTGSADKRFLASTLKSKSANKDGDVRSKRSMSEAEEQVRHKRSVDYYEEEGPDPALKKDWLEGGQETVYTPALEDTQVLGMGNPGLIKAPVKRFLAPMARKNWFPEFYYYGYNI